MEKCKVKIVNKSKNPLPKYATEGAAGLDLYADTDEKILLNPMEIKLIPTGIFIELPIGFEVQIRARSGLSSKYGITMINGVGTIDSDYRGEIKVPLINFGKEKYEIKPGERICQMVVKRYVSAEFELVENLDETHRGSGGFGHSGNL
ncbi:dUTP diphosphatase [Alkalibacter mobilis]|uniref:dUTP diphosphatase n=1 Tax=Alkalibacter mobilis TaxID=2787712 RepID=UPI00189EBD10|nr:dUTP diphosphatase [Alkalibacter mobilis]MBF7095710.1 dUTP diphosphatase [Alkalibacter mobilis]